MISVICAGKFLCFAVSVICCVGQSQSYVWMVSVWVVSVNCCCTKPDLCKLLCCTQRVVGGGGGKRVVDGGGGGGGKKLSAAAAVAAAVAVAVEGGCGCYLLYKIYYFIVMDILFYCDVYIILLC